MSVLPSDTAYRWSRENYSTTRRKVDIWQAVLRLLFYLWLDGKDWSYAGGKRTDELRSRRQRTRAIWLRETLLNLGPTFIKVGQLFSTRADLFPAEYVEELSKLQDRVPAFSYDRVEAIIEAEFGKAIPELYKFFDPTPLAAASLGQVHRAQLHSGEEVVVKIQRPGLRKLFEIDLTILKQIAQRYQRHPRWGKGRDWLGIYDECHRILYQEIDYLNEGRNADTFRRQFRGDVQVVVPRVYWRYTSPRVLTLEYAPGIKVNNYEALEVAGIDRKEIAQIGARTYLQQVLRNGFFHADPHPGNLAVNPNGSLIFYDFGMMGQIQPFTRQKLMRTFFGVAQKNAEEVMQSLIELGALVPSDDPGPVRRSIQYMLDNLMDQPFSTHSELSITAISDDLYDLAYNQPFRFPATFTFVLRAFSTLEGLGKGLDPDFNFMEVAKPFAAEMMGNNGSPLDTGNDLLSQLGRQAAQVSTSALSLPRRIEDTIDKLERGDIRVRVRSTETERLLRRLGNVQMGTNYVLLAGAFLLSATLLLVSGKGWLAMIMGGLAVAAVGAFIRLLLRMNRMEQMF